MRSELGLGILLGLDSIFACTKQVWRSWARTNRGEQVHFLTSYAKHVRKSVDILKHVRNSIDAPAN